MDAAWAQAWLSAAGIIFAAAFAVLVPYLERGAQRKREGRSRLIVTTTRSEPSGLRIDLAYQPEFTHVGLSARVALLSPSGAQLKPMEPAKSVAQVGGRHVVLKPGGTAVDDVAQVRLTRFEQGGDFAGAMLILPHIDDMRGSVDRARLGFEILTDAGERLLRIKLEVSPVDDARSFWDRPS